MDLNVRAKTAIILEENIGEVFVLHNTPLKK
jgi:hypothetical protein